VSDGAYQTVAKVGDIADGVGFACEVGGRPVALFRVAGRYHAFDDACPHQGFPLSDASTTAGALTCLYHGWRFGLDDGCWEENPSVCIAMHAVRVVGDEVQVALAAGE
jgi:nitrite reductase (NADH) small subunit/3-phenylpropionate/trans-cinnamate dioxygenase ferredoxin subunit